MLQNLGCQDVDYKQEATKEVLSSERRLLKIQKRERERERERERRETDSEIAWPLPTALKRTEIHLPVMHGQYMTGGC